MLLSQGLRGPRLWRTLGRAQGQPQGIPWEKGSQGLSHSYPNGPSFKAGQASIGRTGRASPTSMAHVGCVVPGWAGGKSAGPVWPIPIAGCVCRTNGTKRFGQHGPDRTGPTRYLKYLCQATTGPTRAGLGNPQAAQSISHPYGRNSPQWIVRSWRTFCRHTDEVFFIYLFGKIGLFCLI